MNSKFTLSNQLFTSFALRSEMLDFWHVIMCAKTNQAQNNSRLFLIKVNNAKVHKYVTEFLTVVNPNHSSGFIWNMRLRKSIMILAIQSY
jgi:hypothetical protein